MIRYLLLVSLVLALSVPAAMCREKTVQKIDPERLEALMTGKEQSPYVLVALAAWCAPCKRELPGLVRLYEKLKKNGLKIYGISLDFGGPEAIEPVIKQYKVNFPVFWAGEEAIAKYGLSKIPMLILFKDGQVWETIHGYKGEKVLRNKFEELLD